MWLMLWLPFILLQQAILQIDGQTQQLNNQQRFAIKKYQEVVEIQKMLRTIPLDPKCTSSHVPKRQQWCHANWGDYWFWQQGKKWQSSHWVYAYQKLWFSKGVYGMLPEYAP